MTLQYIIEEKTNKLRFMRFMFSFLALEHGFIKGCKWFIGADGCHLTDPYSGVLLSEVMQ